MSAPASMRNAPRPSEGGERAPAIPHDLQDIRAHGGVVVFRSLVL